MVQAVPNLYVSIKVFFKHRVNWNTVCRAMQDLPWRNIWSVNNPVAVLTSENLDPYGGTDLLAMFPLFLNHKVHVLHPCFNYMRCI